MLKNLLCCFFCFTLNAQLVINRPYDRAIYQRSNQNIGKIEVKGTASQKLQKVRARLLPIVVGQGIDTDWQEVKITENGFSDEITGRGGYYKLEIEATGTNNQVFTETINHVGIGEVFIVVGQSNTLGPGPFATDERVGAAYFLYEYGNRKFINLTQSNELIEKWIYPSSSTRAFMGSLGDEFVKKYNVPVMFLAAGLGGTKIELWSNDLETATGAYANLKKTIQVISKEYGTRVILWHHGEANSGYGKTPSQTYQKSLEQLITKTRQELDFENLAWMVAKVSWAKDNTSSPNQAWDSNPDEYRNEVRQAQAAVTKSLLNVFEGPDSDLLTGYAGSELRSDGVHFTYEGQRQLGLLWSQKFDFRFLLNSQPYLAEYTGKKNQSLTLTQVLTKRVNEKPFPLEVRASSGLPCAVKVLAGPAEVQNDNFIQLTGTEGTVVLQIDQTGNQEFRAAKSQVMSFTVERQKSIPSLVFNPIASKEFDENSIEIGLNSNSTANINLRVTKGDAKLNNKTLTILKPSKITLEAIQTANEQFEGIVSRTTFEVFKQKQSVTISPISKKNAFDAPFAVSASATSKLPIKIKVEGPAYFFENKINLIGAPGKVRIIATQEGDDFYEATTAEQSFDVQLILSNETAPEATVTVYPNPSTDYVIVNTKIKLVSAVLVNTIGQNFDAKFERINASNINIQLPNVANGNYILVLKDTDNQSFTHKIQVFK